MEKQKQDIEEFKKELQKEEIVPLGWKVLKGDKLLKMELPESEFLVEKLIPKGNITILAGNPSSGKSWLLMEIAKAVSSNRMLFDKFNTMEAKTLYLDEESSPSEIKRRWKLLDPPYMTLTDFMSLQGFSIDNTEERNALLDLCKARDYKLVVFDSLRDVHSRNENDSRDAQELMDYFKEFCKIGITCLISHHNRKESFVDSNKAEQVLRGSTAILANVDSLLAVENTKRTETELELVVSQPKLRQGKPSASFKLLLTEADKKIIFEYKAEVEEEQTKVERTKQAIIELLKEGERYFSEIVQVLVPRYFSERTIKRAISELKEKQTINLRKGEKNRTYYGLSGQ